MPRIERDIRAEHIWLHTGKLTYLNKPCRQIGVKIKQLFETHIFVRGYKRFLPCSSLSLRIS